MWYRHVRKRGTGTEGEGVRVYEAIDFGFVTNGQTNEKERLKGKIETPL